MAVGIPMTKPAASFAMAGDEPALAELLADPVLQTLMRRDHLSDGDFWAAVERGRAALQLRE